MRFTPARVLLAAGALVAVACVFIPPINAYGSEVYHCVILLAWLLESPFRDLGLWDPPHRPAIVIAGALGYAVPAALVLWLSHRRWPRAGALVLASGCALYLGLLFV